MPTKNSSTGHNHYQKSPGIKIRQGAIKGPFKNTPSMLRFMRPREGLTE